MNFQKLTKEQWWVALPISPKFVPFNDCVTKIFPCITTRIHYIWYGASLGHMSRLKFVQNVLTIEEIVFEIKNISPYQNV